jgi:hypothetical protein
VPGLDLVTPPPTCALDGCRLAWSDDAAFTGEWAADRVLELAAPD